MCSIICIESRFQQHCDLHDDILSISHLFTYFTILAYNLLSKKLVAISSPFLLNKIAFRVKLEKRASFTKYI